MKKAFFLLLSLLCMLALLPGCESRQEPNHANAPQLPSSPTNAPESAQPILSDRRPMVMVNGKLYYDTGKESSLQAWCGTMDGEISSAVDPSEVPTENNQSNFGTGYGYQYGEEDTIIVYIDDKRMVFSCLEDQEEQLCTGLPPAPTASDTGGENLSEI